MSRIGVLAQRMQDYFTEDGEACEECKYCKTTEKVEWGTRITQVQCGPLIDEDRHDLCPVFDKLNEKLREEAMRDGGA